MKSLMLELLFCAVLGYTVFVAIVGYNRTAVMAREQGCRFVHVVQYRCDVQPSIPRGLVNHSA